MRSLLLIFALLMMFFVVGCGEDNDSETMATEIIGNDHGGQSETKDWNELSHSQRNQRIIDEAIGDLDQIVGLSCKRWIQEIVKKCI